MTTITNPPQVANWVGSIDGQEVLVRRYDNGLMTFELDRTREVDLTPEPLVESIAGRFYIAEHPDDGWCLWEKAGPYDARLVLIQRTVDPVVWTVMSAWAKGSVPE